MDKLSKFDIKKVVNYIGVSGGYLGDFSYRTHADFYVDYCELEIDPNDYSGTTRERFISILSEVSANDQLVILQGILKRFPLSHYEHQFDYELISANDLDRKRALYEDIEGLIQKLSGGHGLIELPEKIVDYEFLNNILDQAEILIKEHSVAAALDRTHTALHSYFKYICKVNNISIAKDVKIQDYWAAMKRELPHLLHDVEDYDSLINQMVTTIGKLLQRLNQVRNHNSYSHPNEIILKEEEAIFVVNIMRSHLHYIHSKTKEKK